MKSGFLLSAFVGAALLFAAVEAAPQSLGERWRAIAAEARGRVGVAAAIIESGETAEMNGAEHFPMQSVYKLPISMAVLQLVDAGKLSLEKSVEVRPGGFYSGG